MRAISFSGFIQDMNQVFRILSQDMVIKFLLSRHILIVFLQGRPRGVLAPRNPCTSLTCISFKVLRGIKSRCDDQIALTCFWPKIMASGPLGNANSPIGNKAINPTSLDGSGIQQLRRTSTSQITPAELTRPSNIQRILQKKAQVKAYPRLKKLEKLGVYSSCKVSIV